MIPLIFLTITNGTLWKKIPELRGIYSKSAFYTDTTYHKSPMISIKEIEDLSFEVKARLKALD